MRYTYFPVRLAALRARLACHELGEGAFWAGGVRVQTQYLNHTAPALGYRLTVGGVTVVYASDRVTCAVVAAAPGGLAGPEQAQRQGARPASAGARRTSR
jgi:hypothetical protein